MGIQTVFFDVGNTLLTPAVPEGEILVRAVDRLGVVLDPALVRRSVPRMYEYYEELYEADNSLWASQERAVDIWRILYEYLCELVGIPELGPQVARIGYEEFLNPANWKPFDDVLPTLAALRSRGVVLGLISNWDSSLESIIRGVGIEPWFDVIISSAVVGLHKPQPEIFRLALDRMGVKPDVAMHVGDHLQADVGGAAAVGITPVLIDRDNQYEDEEGYIRVQALQEVVEYL
jgi:putative hydrolase of the HAD superfamily